jgi:hypothetical protein
VVTGGGVRVVENQGGSWRLIVLMTGSGNGGGWLALRSSSAGGDSSAWELVEAPDPVALLNDEGAALGGGPG